MSEKIGLTEWFANKNIFITGGTGFMGKVLVEKLARCMPAINKIYVLVREKRNVDPQERMRKILALPVFDKLRSIDAKQLSKIVAIAGDITQKDLGLSANDANMLRQCVHIVFHNAASLKLEAELRDAIIMNTITTRTVLDFCSKIDNLQVCLHTSTAFCHVDVDHLEEKIYPSPHDPEYIYQLLELFDDDTLRMLTPKILGPHPNCYTYSKRLAETIAYKYGEIMPIVIVRPSIVIPVLHEPLPGWVDTLNGPVGLMAGAGKGVIRSMLVQPENHAEVAPVDMAINAMITAAYYRARRDQTLVFNLTTGDRLNMTWGEVFEKFKKIGRENPLMWPLWYPDGNIRTNKFVHNMMVFWTQIVPAYFIDFLLILFMQKPFLVRIQKRIVVGLDLLQYFTMREWRFSNKLALKIADDLTPEEQEIFYMENTKYDVDVYLQTSLLGARKFLLKEDLSNIPTARKIQTGMYILDRFVKLLFVVGALYLILKLFNLLPTGTSSTFERVK